MNIIVEVPPNLPDAVQSSPVEFSREAKLAMAVKLFEMKRLSSGLAAALAGVGRVEFLFELHRFGAPVVDLTRAELEADTLLLNKVFPCCLAASIRVPKRGAVKVSSTGALSIPRPILESVAVEPGAEFTIEADGYSLRLLPVVPFPPKTVDEVGGCLHRPVRKAKTDDEMNAAVRTRAQANDRATKQVIYAATPGTVTVDLKSLPYQKVRRLKWPLD